MTTTRTIRLDAEREERLMRTVAPPQASMRLDQFVAQAFEGFSRGTARNAINDGEIWLNGQPCKIQSRSLRQGDRVTWLQLPGPPAPLNESQREMLPDADPAYDWRPFGGPPVYLFRDNYLAVINKPSGMPIEPTNREDLQVCLRQVEATQVAEGMMARRRYVAAVHRLDAGASGAVAFALRKRAAGRLSEQFASRTATRRYRLLVVGQVSDDEGTIDAPIGKVGPGIKRGVTQKKQSKRAISHFRVLERFDVATLLEVRLETGRTHQIRVHMAHLGYPLIGDWLYCDDAHASLCPEAPRLMLHAHTLRLTHPQDGTAIHCEAPLDQAFTGYLDTLSPA